MGALLTTLALFASVMVGSSAAWTATDTNPGNSLHVIAGWQLSSWGTAASGQTGVVLQATTSNTAVRLPGPEQWSVVSAGEYSTCSVTTARKLYCWGLNNYGQLGTGDTTNRNDPVAVATVSSWQSVSVGYVDTCGIKTDQSLWCWGYNPDGEVGNTTTTSPQSTPVAVTTSGTATWLSVSVGQYFTCGVKTDNTLWCWGWDANGRLGIGSTTIETAPTQVGTSTWSTVGTGYAHACAVSLTDHSLWCWGSNNDGQVGDATTIDRLAPTAVSGGGVWTTVDGGISHTCAIKTNGTLWCWGWGADGELGHNDTVTVSAPEQEHSLATTWTTLALMEYATCATQTGGVLWCWGLDDVGQLGDGANTNQTVPVLSGSTAGWTSLTGGEKYFCGVRTGDQAVWCQGWNNDDAMGQDTAQAPAPTPVQPSSSVWTSGAQGTWDGCGVRSPGTLWCWGLNNYGENGTGTTAQDVYPVQAGTATNWSSLSIGNQSVCAINTSATMYCWGRGGYYQAGTNTTADQYSPMPGPTGAWSAVSVGETHTCAITTASALWCWGINDQGQLGQNTTATATTPVPVTVAGVTWASVSAGYQDTCAVTTAASSPSNALYCWGYNNDGQVGIGSVADVVVPTRVGTAAWSSVAVGYFQACGVSGGSLYCWGNDSSGQVGNSAPGTNVTTPVNISGGVSTWVQAAAGNNFSCALRSDRTMWCWGTDAAGQLGDRGSTQANAPRQLPIVAFGTIDGHGDVDGMVAFN